VIARHASSECVRAPVIARAQASARRSQQEAPFASSISLSNETRVATERPQTPTKVSIMTRHFLSALVMVKDGERALLTRNGRLERVLEPGRHRLFDPKRQLTVEIFNVVRAEFPAERYAVLKAARPDLAAELFEVVETKANEIAIVSLDGRPVHLMTPWQVRVY